MRLRRVEPHELGDLWETLRGRVSSCCARSGGKYEPVDVLTLCLTRRMDLWVAVDDTDKICALGLTEIVEYPRNKVCKFLACTGENAADWTGLLGSLEAWAKAQGCAAMEPICRPGWERFLSAHGYRKRHVEMEKRL